MDEQRRQIVEDLTGLLRGQVRCDPVTVALYSTDSSLYQIEPLGVVFPVDTEDVAALAAYAAERGIPLTARGAGSQVAGGAIGPGLIVDFSRHFQFVELLDDERVRVGAGTYLRQLNETLKPVKRVFPPDPANANVTTIGGMLGVNASGSRSVQVGTTADYVESIELVLADGTVVECGTERVAGKADNRSETVNSLSDSSFGRLKKNKKPEQVKAELVQALAVLLDAFAEKIEQYQNGRLVRNVSGYRLNGVLEGDTLNLPLLLTGSEGTLGLFTRVVLRTAEWPKARAVVLLVFDSLEAALEASQRLAEFRPSACDLFDKRLLAIGREYVPTLEQVLPSTAEALLFVEQTGESVEEAKAKLKQVVEAATRRHRAEVVREAETPEEVEFLWSMPRLVVPLLNRLPGERRPMPFIEDVAVPPQASVEFLQRVQRVLQKHRVMASFYAHAAAGQFHIRPFLPPPTPQTAAQYEALARDVYEQTFAVGGTVSGEHGNGLARSAFVREQYGPLYKVFEQVKRLFDPHNLMNPDKIVTDDTRLTTRYFRHEPPPENVPLSPLLCWPAEQLADVAASCNGCARCRSLEPNLRMCPFFRSVSEEEASPRAKANLWRHLACGDLPNTLLATPDLLRLADSCFNCKQCVLECPSSVDVPRLAIELKAAYVSSHGLNRTDWLLSRAHLFCEIGCLFPRVANWCANNLVFRWLLEKTFGVTRHRPLPKFVNRTFLKKHGTVKTEGILNGLSKSTVVFFVDHEVNYHRPEIGEALLKLLERLDFEVIVPAEQTVSGMSMLSVGDVAAAKRLAQQNVRELVEFAREGALIVCTEPAAAVCLKFEYPLLLDHPDVQTVAEQVVDAGQLLWQLYQQGRLPTDFASLPVTLAYHVPCQTKALNVERPFGQLLQQIPELHVRTLDRGCSGMAGLFGWRSDQFELSLQIGSELIAELARGEFDLCASECSACRQQMIYATAKPVVHPLQVVAHALGVVRLKELDAFGPFTNQEGSDGERSG